MRDPKPKLPSKRRPDKAQEPTQLSPADKFRMVDSSDPMVQALETNEDLRDALTLRLNQRFRNSTAPAASSARKPGKRSS